MRRILLILSLLLPMLSFGAEHVWKPQEVKIPFLVDSTQYVSNPDGVLGEAAVDSINIMLGRLRLKTGVQSVVVVVKRIENADAYSFGMQIGRKYGVGDKQKRTGLIIILASEDRCYQILTGNGLEGTLTDATCRMIEVHHMDPYLKQGQWDRAMTEGVKAICAVVEKDTSLSGSGGNEKQGGSPLLFLALLGVIGLFVWVMREAAKTRCPRCGRKDMTVKERRLLRRDEPYDYYELTYRCRQCGYEQKEIVRERHEDGGDSVASGLAAGALFGSLMGRGRGGWGGGGFGGGTFGGGSFGGGGAGGHF